MSLYNPADNTGSALASRYTAGSGSFALSSASGFPSGGGYVTAITAATYQTSSETLALYLYTGVSGNTLTGVSVVSGFTDQTFSIGDIVEMRDCAEYINNLNSAVAALQSAGYLTAPVTNAELQYDSITICGHNVVLGGSQNLTGSDVGLGSVSNAAQTLASIVPNTAPSSGQIPVGNSGGTAYAPQTVSGSGATITLSAAGVFAISSIANSALANSSITICGHSVSLGDSQNLANSDVGLGSVTNNAQTQAAIVPNTAPSAGQILVGNSGGTAYAPQSCSGDMSLTSSGATTNVGLQGNPVVSGTPTDGLLLIGSSADSKWHPATLTAGSNVTITNGHGSITIAASGGGSSGYNPLEVTFFGAL